MKKRNYLFLIAALLVALMTTALNTVAMAQQVTGAIFTTNADSTFVNGNVYDYPEEVYLNGGPRPNAPCTAAGLPEGDYYFQVTDPSGSMLLSTDDISHRAVHVKNGLMDVHYGDYHVTGDGKCITFDANNITVRLFPFSRTPNPGGEYKVWMTKISDYDPTSTKGSYGFIPNKSKTDNFKVVDFDGDGVPDSDDACPDDPNCGGDEPPPPPV
jgi:hypothetical protein